MGFSETGSSNCRRHPTHKQSPGVCSSCLREKLSKLSISPPSFNSKKAHIISQSSSQSSTPPYSSSASSTATATATRGNRHRRNGSESYVSVGMVLNNGLKKSRSVSCAPLTSRSKLGANDVINEKVDNNTNNLKKKNGFLKKLIHSTSKKTKGVLMHSKTMRERSHPSTNNNNNNTATSTNQN